MRLPLGWAESSGPGGRHQAKSRRPCLPPRSRAWRRIAAQAPSASAPDRRPGRSGFRGCRCHSRTAARAGIADSERCRLPYHPNWTRYRGRQDRPRMQVSPTSPPPDIGLSRAETIAQTVSRPPTVGREAPESHRLRRFLFIRPCGIPWAFSARASPRHEKPLELKWPKWL